MREHDIYWIFLSPAANLGNLKAGERTGKYRMGKSKKANVATAT